MQKHELQLSAFFMVQLAHSYLTTGKKHSFYCTDLCQQGDCGKFLKRYQATLHVSWETFMCAKKQQLELNMEQLTGSKLGEK